MEGINTNVHIENINFTKGNTDLTFSSNVVNAGGVYVYYGACACDHSDPCSVYNERHKDRTNVIITNCTFANNHGFKDAAILLDLVVDDQDLNGRNVLGI